MQCDERDRLHKAYHEAVRNFHQSVRQLRDLVRSPEFDQAFQKTESADRAVEETLAALEGHRSKHGC